MQGSASNGQLRGAGQAAGCYRDLWQTRVSCEKSCEELQSNATGYENLQEHAGDTKRCEELWRVTGNCG